MNHLLRKIFFWDAPALGAFFGLTLLPAVVWFAFSFWCGIMVIDYSTFQNGAVCLTLFFASLAILAYIAFLLGRMLVVACLKTSFRWWRLGAALFFLVLSLGYVALCCFHGFQYGNDWKWVAGSMLVVHCILLLFPIIFTSWKAIAGALSWLGAFNVFWTLFACAYQPLRSGGFREMSLTDWTMRLVPYVDSLQHFFTLDKNASCIIFVSSGILLLVAGYLIYGSLMADYAKISPHRMFKGEVRWLLGIGAASYAVFLALALWNTVAYRRAIRDLETHFGHPMTMEELERQFYEERPANPEFWKELEELRKEYSDSLDEDERTYSWHPFAVLPESLHTKWKRSFLDNASRQKLEQMISEPIPPPKRNYADDQPLMAMPCPEFAELREIVRMEMHHIGFSLEDNDFDAVSSALDRMDFCREYLWKDHSYIAYLVGIAVTSFRLQAMERILATVLPTNEWLKTQSAKLAEIERQVEEREEHFAYGEAVIYLNVFHWMAYYAGKQDFPRGLHFHSLRFFFPQGWWLAANEVKGMARAIHVNRFSQLPQKGTGYIITDMLLPALSKGSEKRQSIVASCRILRGLIQAELHKRRTGEYPDSLDDLPLDPFTGQPLKYRKGSCQAIEMVYKEKKEEEDDNGELPDSHYIDYDANYATLERTMEAVQIWGVGTDGIDDGGIANKPEYGSSEKKKDDIRFIISIK
ncbi:MAG: hypothetical protein IKP58_10030 [Victivallales bacterium]|nr:hypothetical protein [Victivallales bacterium]